MKIKIRFIASENKAWADIFRKRGKGDLAYYVCAGGVVKAFDIIGDKALITLEPGDCSYCTAKENVELEGNNVG